MCPDRERRETKLEAWMGDKAWNHTSGGSDWEISAFIQEFPGNSKDIGQVCMPQPPPGWGLQQPCLQCPQASQLHTLPGWGRDPWQQEPLWPWCGCLTGRESSADDLKRVVQMVVCSESTDGSLALKTRPVLLLLWSPLH